MWRMTVALAALAELSALFAPGALAHEIPTDVTVRVFVKPEGRTLRLLVRVPLEAMRDIRVPIRGQGFLDTFCITNSRFG